MSAHGADGFGLTELSLNRTWSFSWPDERKPFQITPGIGVHFLSGADSLNLPNAVYDVSLNLSWRVLELAHGGVSVGVTPGYYGDFRTISDETFQVTGWVTGDLQLGPHWSLVGGVAVVRQLQSSWLPVGGVIWSPTDDWQLEFLIPRPRIARRIHQTEERDVWGYVVGQFGGGSWAVDDGSGGNQLLSYSDLRLVAGLNVWRSSGREISCEIGYVFSRDLALAGYSMAAPDNTWVVQAVWVF